MSSDAAGSCAERVERTTKKSRCPFDNNRRPRILRSHAPMKTCRCAASASYNDRTCRQWLRVWGNHFCFMIPLRDRIIQRLITGYNELAPPCTAREWNRADRRAGRAGEKMYQTRRGITVYIRQPIKRKIQCAHTKEDTGRSRKVVSQ